MENYTNYRPTKLIFGKGEIKSLGSTLKSDGIERVLIHYGSGSIFKQYMDDKPCVYDQVTSSLKEHGIQYFNAGGQVSNPLEKIALESYKILKDNNCQAVVSVGGGSVLDSSKFICAMNDYSETPERTFEELYIKLNPAKNPLPLYNVLTMSGTGSEMNQGAVITSVKGYKTGGIMGVFPTVSIIDPEVQYSLPQYQVQCGLIDAFCHIYEYYTGAGFANGGQVPVTITHMCESVLRDILTSSKRVVNESDNYQLRAEICFQCMVALDFSLAQGFLPTGYPELICTCHQLSHTLTNLYGVTHGAANGLIMMGMFYLFDKHPEFNNSIRNMHERLSKEVFGVSTISEGREALRKHLEMVGLPTKLQDAIKADDYELVIKELTKRYNELWKGLFELTEEMVHELLSSLL